jgi:hypothetical protein
MDENIEEHASPTVEPPRRPAGRRG